LITRTRQTTKTVSKIEDDFITSLAESIDFSQVRSGQKISLELNLEEHLYLLKHHQRRTIHKLENLLQNAIGKFWSVRIAEALVPSDQSKLESMLEQIAENAEKTRYTLIKQQITKLVMNGDLEWVFSVYKNVLGIVTVNPQIFKPIPLSAIGASLIDRLVCFDCTINGMEAQQAIEDAYETQKSGRVYAEKYSKERDGNKKDTYYEDFQYYWLEENTGEYSKKKILRKIPGKAFGRFVGTFETGDKVRVTGFYRTVGSGSDSKNNNTVAMDVEIEIINMEKLEDDAEITISFEELQQFKKLADENPDEFISQITSSFAPHIVENSLPKFALLLSVIGSAKLKKYRTHIHVYLVGNPGTAKSEMIKALAKIRYLAVYADAPNASARGLMYSQEDWGKRKILKAGLVVKHELLALDELDKMGSTRQELNTTMEQQIATYNKNPFNIQTPINCTIVACGNPQNGRWNDAQTLMDNLKPIESELLSRFLIIRVFKSTHTAKRLKHILDTIQQRDTVRPIFSERQIAGLISHCRKLEPELSPEAEKEIISFAEFFEGVEQNSDSDLPFETRQEIELIRISTAIAKFLQRDSVDSVCVKLAIKFMKECLMSLGMKTKGRLVGMNLYDQAANKDDAFVSIIRKLERNSADGSFTESDLIEEMLTHEDHWRTKESAHAYWKRFNPTLNRTSQYYEPKPGRYKKVS